jgi:dihydroxyacetone kinase
MAGFGAELGISLAQLKKSLEGMVLPNLYTIGCSFQSTHTDLAVDEMEIGMGLHGEPGCERIKVKRSKGTMRLMVQKLVDAHAKRTEGR